MACPSINPEKFLQISHGTRADNESVGRGSNGLTNVNGSRGLLPMTPLTDDSINQISRTISMTFGIRPLKHASLYCDKFGDIHTS